MTIRLTVESGGFVLHSPYNAGFVAAFKATIPGSSRRWDKDRRVWLFDPSVSIRVVDLCETFFHTRPHVPTLINTPVWESRILDVRYVGMTKDRGEDDRSAFGCVGGAWSVLFPEKVLMEWFCAIPTQPGEYPTLFGVLGVSRDVDADGIKGAYRRLAKQWHPDVCHEPNAAETFKAVSYAYQTLSDDTKRRKYLAGLALEASLAANTQGGFAAAFCYRAPLRCGLILADGVERLSVFNVSKINLWEDIVDPQGRVLVTSWPAGAQTFMEVWQ